MTERIIVAGSGGQGVLTLGLFLAQNGISEKKNVTYLPSYGAEKRGGFSFCSIVISDEEIYSPIIEKPDTLIVFDQRALESYSNKIANKTLVIVNSSLIKDQKTDITRKIKIPATTIARKVSFIKAMNIVIAGAYFAAKSIFHIENAYNVLTNMLVNKSKEIVDKNIKAFNKGMEFVRKELSGLQFC